VGLKVSDKILNNLKLDITKQVFNAIADHMSGGGTYRYLIYDRLGFDGDAYSELLVPGMYLSNEISDLKELKKRHPDTWDDIVNEC